MEQYKPRVSVINHKSQLIIANACDKTLEERKARTSSFYVELLSTRRINK